MEVKQRGCLSFKARSWHKAWSLVYIHLPGPSSCMGAWVHVCVAVCPYEAPGVGKALFRDLVFVLKAACSSPTPTQTRLNAGGSQLLYLHRKPGAGARGHVLWPLEGAGDARMPLPPLWEPLLPRGGSAPASVGLSQPFTLCVTLGFSSLFVK